jgi:hypothetical protein
MTARMRHIAALSLAAIAAGLAMLCAEAAAAETVSPLPISDYTVRAVCAEPGPGRAGCLALALVPRTTVAGAGARPLAAAPTRPLAAPSPKDGEIGLTPADLHMAYELPTEAPTTQTIALIDAYNDPTAQADLKAYDEAFDLPECTGSCFTKVNQRGETTNLPFPKTTGELEEASGGSEAEEASGWSVEISLDIEVARATCQSCHILLVEADSPAYTDLEAAEDWATEHGGAEEISNSWGGPEKGQTLESAKPFDHPGTVITAAAGDDGYLNWAEESKEERGFALFPASSPYVLAVGGTRLLLNETSGTWQGETVWNDGGESGGVRDGYGAGGGGCSRIFTAPSWQESVSDWPEVGCNSGRAVADVAADADPYTGVAVRDTTPGSECDTEYEEASERDELPGWCTIGGTSLASPLIASVFALAGGAGGVEYPAKTLYENQVKSAGSLHDVTEGSNGECSKPFNEHTGLSTCMPEEEARASCSSKLICNAGKGYDGPTGVGTPNGIEAFQPPKEPPGEKGKGPEEQSKGGSGEGTGSGGGGSPTSGQSSSSAGSSSAGSATGGPSIGETTAAAPTGNAPVQLSALALTLKALIALNSSRPKASQVAFAFTINTATQVRVTLAKRIRTRKHARWQVLRDSLTIAAASGRNSRRLSGRGVLSAGLYRLTLTPMHGAARSIVFQIG